MSIDKEKKEEIAVLLNYLDGATGTSLCREAAATIRYLMEINPSAAIRNAALDVDALANEIRRFDGSHKLGAGALAEALLPFLQSSPATKQDGWQPIETAPKDAGDLLLRDSKGNHANGNWLKEAYAGNGAWVWPYVHREPTHWMPLPPDPQSTESKEGA